MAVPDEERCEVEFSLDGLDGEADLSDASDSLLEELSLVDFDRLDRPRSGRPEPGTRVGDPVVLGTLVGLFSSPVVLRAAVDVVRSWLVRQKRGTVTVKIGKDTIELTSATRDQQEALVKAFLDRHAGR